MAENVWILDSNLPAREKLALGLGDLGLSAHGCDPEDALHRLPGAASPELLLSRLPVSRKAFERLERGLSRTHPFAGRAWLRPLQGASEVRDARAGTGFAILEPHPDPGLIASWLPSTRQRARGLRAAALERLETQRRLSASPIVATSPRSIALLETLEELAEDDRGVWFYGEAGTGKEVLARALHAWSPRRRAPFSTFSIREAGASHLWTEVCDLLAGGTLFVEDFEGLPEAIRAGILARSAEATDDGFRLIVGSRQAPSPKAEIASLFSGRALRVPPLRERPSDIPLLVDHFIESHRRSLSAPGLCARNDALALLKAYAWPGNIRELASVVAGASRRANGGPIGREHLPTRVAGALANGLENGQSLRAARQCAERRSVQDALEAAGGHRGRAAQQLGISSRSLLYKIKEYGLRAPDQRRS